MTRTASVACCSGHFYRSKPPGDGCSTPGSGHSRSPCPGVRRRNSDDCVWYKASTLGSAAKQRNRKSALPTPHGHHGCRTTTAALQIADHYCVTLRVALEASGTVASGGQRPSMSGASKQCNGPGEHKSGRRIPPAKQQCRGAGYHSAMPMEQRPVGCPLAT